MEYRNLGRTGVKVTPLCLGTMNFGPRTPEDESIKLIDAFLDAGHNFIDTANFYGQPLKDGRGQGISEEIIGKALKANGKRDRVVLATKVVARTAQYPEDPNQFGSSRRHIMQEVENSLRRLQTNYIDVYQFHGPIRYIHIEERMRAMDDLVRQGKIRYIGTSNHLAWELMESLWTSASLNLNRIVSEQSYYHMAHRLMEREVVPVAEKYGIALIPYSPLGGGILTGKYKREQPFPEGSRFKFQPWDGFWSVDLVDAVYDLVDVLEEMAKEKDCTISQLVLAWTVNQTGITSPIIGPRTMEQLEDNMGALEVELTDEDFERIDKVSPPRGTLLTDASKF